jgi:hypothetical protein
MGIQTSTKPILLTTMVPLCIVFIQTQTALIAQESPIQVICAILMETGSGEEYTWAAGIGACGKYSSILVKR